MSFQKPMFLAASALLALSIADYPRNVYEDAAQWTRTFTEATTWTLESMVQTLNGSQIEFGNPVMGAELERSFTVADVYGDVREGRLLERKRELSDAEGKVAMSLDVMGESEAYSAELSLPLEGLAIRCKWDEATSEHRFSFEDDDGDASWLERLEADAEFGMLAADEEVEEGDSWTVDLSDARPFFAPSGRLPWKAEPTGVSYEMLYPQHVLAVCLLNLSDLASGIEGEVEVTWTETRTEGDRSIAVLQLELEATLKANLSPELVRLSAAAEISDLSIVQHATVALEGEGSLEWDLAAGHFHSFDMELESLLDLTMEWSEGTDELRVETELSGVTRWSAQAKSAK